MDAEELKQHLSQQEVLKLEFKLKYVLSGQGKEKIQDEVAKDILALTNTGGRHAKDYVHLIIGAGNELRPNGSREREDVRKFRYSRQQFLDIVNARCYPPLADLEYEEIDIDGNYYGVIIIPPSPHVHVPTRDLNTPKGSWRKNDVLVRRGDGVGVASPEEIELMVQQKKQWMRQAVDIPRDARMETEGLWEEVCELLHKEVHYVNHECARTSDKPLDAIFVKRSFAEWKPTSDEMSEAEGREPDRDEGKPWSSVIEHLGAAVVLSNPGFGKTVSLLREVQERCRIALTRLQAQDIALDELTFAVYLHANRLAKNLTDTKEPIVECTVRLLAERHQPVSKGLKAWLRQKLGHGQILLAVDALDEVSQGYELALKEGLGMLARSTPCPLLFSARRVGYTTPPVWPVTEWELLPFTPGQLRLAARQWFREDPELAKKFAGMINRTPHLANLLTNPLLFMLACQVWEGPLKKGEPMLTFSRRCDLYQRFIEYFRTRWVKRIEEVEQKKPTYPEYEAFLPFIEEVAWQLWHRDPRRSIFFGSEISEVVENTPKPRALEDRADLLRDICESGLLTKAGTEEADAPYLFLHRTLLEFLAACRVARKAEYPTAHVAPVAEVRDYFANPDAHAMLWMLAGKLKNPAPLLKEMVAWAKQRLESQEEVAADIESPMLSQLLVDCLFECRADTFDVDTLEASWELVTRGLDRMQRRKRGRGGEWGQLADWSLIYRALHAVETHEGVVSRAEQMLSVLNDLRQAKMRKGGVLLEDAVPDVAQQLNQVFKSPCPIVRWAAVWTTASLHAKGRTELMDKFADSLAGRLERDESPHVRSIAARALVQIRHPRAFALLKGALDGECRMTAAGAAIGFGHLMTSEAITVLKAKAQSILEEPVSGPHDPLLLAVIGALESVVDEARKSRDTTFEWVLRDEELANIFIRALEYPVPHVKGPAASALGKMGWKAAWEPLKKLVELPDDGQNETRKLRASGCYACDQLCLVIDEAEFSQVAEFFLRRLRDTKEIPEVRRPAASGLEKLARRGYFSPRDVNDVLRGARDRDPMLARSCMLTLTRFKREAVLEDLILLLRQFDKQRRKLLCEVVRNQPTMTGLALLSWLLENDAHPDIILEALTAVGEAGKKALNWQLFGRPDYLSDVEPLRNLTRNCIELSKHQMPQVICTSLFTLEHLAVLPPFQRGEPLYSLREEMAAQARLLLRHMDERVQASAYGTLGLVGEQADVAQLTSLEEQSESEMVRKSARGAIKRLQQQLLRG